MKRRASHCGDYKEQADAVREHKDAARLRVSAHGGARREETGSRGRRNGTGNKRQSIDAHGKQSGLKSTGKSGGKSADGKPTSGKSSRESGKSDKQAGDKSVGKSESGIKRTRDKAVESGRVVPRKQRMDMQRDKR